MQYASIQSSSLMMYPCFVPCSKTLVQPAAPVAKKSSSRKVAESASDQENVSIPVEGDDPMAAGAASCWPADVNSRASSRKNTADTMLTSSQPTSKKLKKAAKSKKKALPLPKGQKQLTAFFRL